MKLLSIAIPCYNSAAYMENCIRSLLPGGNEVEILIVDDGSTKTIRRRSQMNMNAGTLESAGPSTRKTAATARLSTRD